VTTKSVPSGPQTRTRTVQVKSPVPFYGAGAAALLYALLLPLYSWLHLILFAVFTAAVFLLLEKFWPRKTITVEEPVLPSTGNAQADRFLYEGRLILSRIRQINDKIADPELTAEIDQLEQLTEDILNRIEEVPGKADHIRRFAEYYLPTVLKMLENYVSMSGKGLTGDNVQASLASVEKAMDQVLVAFRRQLDSLYDEEALDITTDAAVLENLLKREGLLDPDFTMETAAEAIKDERYITEPTEEGITLTLGR